LQIAVVATEQQREATKLYGPQFLLQPAFCIGLKFRMLSEQCDILLLTAAGKLLWGDRGFARLTF